MTSPFERQRSAAHTAQEMLPQQPEVVSLHMRAHTIAANSSIADVETTRRVTGIGFDGTLKAIVYPGMHTQDAGAIFVFQLSKTDQSIVPLISNNHNENTTVLEQTGGLPFIAMSQESLDHIKELSDRQGSAKHVAGSVEAFGAGKTLDVGRAYGNFACKELVRLPETSRNHLTLGNAPNGDLMIIDHSTNGSMVVVPTQ